MTILHNLPNLLAYFACAVALLAIFIVAYTKVTPIDEWAEIRAGNAAAALGLSGAILGFALPLGSSIVHSASLLDMAAWALVSLLLQLGCFWVMHLLYRDVSVGSSNATWRRRPCLRPGLSQLVS